MSDLPHEPGGWLATYAPFQARVELETAARVAMGIDSPWVVPIRSWCPVVHAEPPPILRPSEPLSPREAATCLVQLCDVLSRAHAGGWAGLAVDAHDVRLVPDGGSWRVAVVLPHLEPRWRRPRTAGGWSDPSVRRDLRSAVLVLVDLLTATLSGKIGRVPDVGDPGIQAVLDEVLHGDEDPVGDAAGLAGAVLPLVPELAPLVDRMPRVREVRVRHDWDRLIALGEAELAAALGDRYRMLPLAAAYHQRAVERLATDPAAARRDLDRAVDLDPAPKILTTRALARAEAGDPRAGEDLDRALVVLPEFTGYGSIWSGEGNIWDVARALYVRAVWRHRDRDVTGAAADLHLAEVLLSDRPEDPLRRVVEQAAVPIRRAVARADGSADARWSLVRALVRVGRTDDARVEADAVLAGPDGGRFHPRYARLFGAERPA